MPTPRRQMPRRIYPQRILGMGLGGMVVPFIGIKLIDMVLAAMGVA